MPQRLPAVYRKRTANKLIQSLKEATLASLNTQARSVLRQRDLGTCLLAFGLDRDALAVFDYADRSVTFRGKYDVWYAAASACALSTYVRRVVLHENHEVVDLQRFLAPPAHAVVSQSALWTPSFVQKHLTGELARFQPSFTHAKPQVALEALSWWIASLIFFHEMAHLGHPSRTSNAYRTRLHTSAQDAMVRIRGILGDNA